MSIMDARDLPPVTADDSTTDVALRFAVGVQGDARSWGTKVVPLTDREIRWWLKGHYQLVYERGTRRRVLREEIAEAGCAKDAAGLREVISLVRAILTPHT
jgi:hypothetical protein